MNYKKKLDELRANDLYRERKVISSPQSTHIKIANEHLINFSSNDYLSLANHPEVKSAFIKGIEKYGVGSGASHLVSGHFDIHDELERKLSEITGQENSLVFSSGFAANLGIFTALSEELDWVLQDRLNHASLIDANRMIGKRVDRYKHNNILSLEKKLNKKTGFGLIATDHIFSMDGDQADINLINQISKCSNSLLLQDDAHGFGIFDVNIPDQSIYMATFGKSVGAMGAFVSASNDFIELLKQKARSYIYTTAIPPAVAAAIIKSLSLVKKGEQKTKLLKNIALFREVAKNLDIRTYDSHSGIQPIIIGNNKKTMSIAEHLMKKGFIVGAIRAPTVAKGSERIRITLSSDHKENEICSLLEELKIAL